MEKYNSIEKQRKQWSGAVMSQPNSIYGYSWGDPELEAAHDSTGKILGNYKKIKDDYILKHLTKEMVIVDLGSLGGKWTQFFLGAGKIICADINQEGFSIIKKFFPQDNIEFYLTKGYELDGISDKSVDIIFCMDTLVRSELGVMRDYITEIKRVLKESGKACIHLPCSDSVNSVERGFTSVSKKDISDMCASVGINDFKIDKDTINHGVLLLIGYANK